MSPNPATPSHAPQRSIRSDAAFEELFERHLGLIYRFVAARVGPSEADDIAAEIFFVAYRKRGTFRGEQGSARAWLLGIAANVLRNHSRGGRRRLAMVRRLTPETLQDQTTEIHSRVDAQAAAARLKVALDSLRPVERDVFLLSAWGDLGYQEIATALDIPLGTVKSLLSRARTKLQSRMGESNGDAEQNREEETES